MVIELVKIKPKLFILYAGGHVRYIRHEEQGRENYLATTCQLKAQIMHLINGEYKVLNFQEFDVHTTFISVPCILDKAVKSKMKL